MNQTRAFPISFFFPPGAWGAGGPIPWDCARGFFLGLAPLGPGIFGRGGFLGGFPKAPGLSLGFGAPGNFPGFGAGPGGGLGFFLGDFLLGFGHNPFRGFWGLNRLWVNYSGPGGNRPARVGSWTGFIWKFPPWVFNYSGALGSGAALLWGGGDLRVPFFFPGPGRALAWGGLEGGRNRLARDAPGGILFPLFNPGPIF